MRQVLWWRYRPSPYSDRGSRWHLDDVSVLHLRDGNVAIGGSISHKNATNRTASVVRMSRVSAVIPETYTSSCIVIGTLYGPGSCPSRGSRKHKFPLRERNERQVPRFSCSCVLSCVHSSPPHMLAQVDTAKVSIQPHAVLVAVKRRPSVCGCSVCRGVREEFPESPRVRRHVLVWS